MDRRTLFGLAAVAASASAAPAWASDTGGGGGDPYTRLPTLTANIGGAGPRRAIMTVEAGVDCPDAALRPRVARSLPRLRAAYASVLQRVANETLSGSPPDVERLVALLQTATDTTLGRRGARLLIGTVMVV
jgi:flagellar basal body-associated protein FliL